MKKLVLVISLLSSVAIAANVANVFKNIYAVTNNPKSCVLNLSTSEEIKLTCDASETIVIKSLVGDYYKQLSLYPVQLMEALPSHKMTVISSSLFLFTLDK